MPASTLPCAAIDTFCAEDVRVEMRCECGDTEKIEFPNVMRAEVRPRVTRAQRTRYYGTQRQFVSGCAGRRELDFVFQVKLCLDEPLEQDHLFHGECACFTVIPDPDKPSESFEAYGRILMDQPQAIDNNSTEEVTLGWTVELLTEIDWSNMPQTGASLTCP